MNPMYKYVKRFFDIILSGSAILLLIIPMWIITGIIVLEDPGPSIFRQRRIGKGKKEFEIFKYRSMKMTTPHDVPTHLLKNPEQYILKCGKWMRSLSIDELPQLFNILKGDMSFVGPRPALWNQSDLISERDRYGANDIKPGLTGWAQINGRDELEIPDKARLDGEYVRKQGLLMDLRCFFGTFIKVLRRDGVVEGGTGEIHKQEMKK